MTRNVTTANREFFDSLYGSTPTWLAAVRALTSFDQQTKAKPNYAIAKSLAKSMAVNSSKLRILDYGAGWGTFLLKWPSRTASCWCYDMSRESVRHCLNAGRLFGRKIAEWPDGGEPFDLVCCSHVLEHVPDDLALLRQLRSLTRQGGIVLLNVPINEVLADPKHARRYDRGALVSVIEAAGLALVVESEGDRLSTFLARREGAGTVKPLSRLIWRTLRFLLALAPYCLLAQIDRMLLPAYAPSQLIVCARNCS